MTIMKQMKIYFGTIKYFESIFSLKWLRYYVSDILRFRLINAIEGKMGNHIQLHF